METIALRLVLPPLIILVASLAQRRLGDRLGGIVVGLPLTSGTFLLLLAISHGSAAVAPAAAGMLAGQIAVVVMAGTYAAGVPRLSPATALLVTVLVWTGTVTLVDRTNPAALVTALGYATVALASWALWPRTAVPQPPSSSPGGEPTVGQGLLLRVAIGTTLVVALTQGVHLLGPGLAGTLAAAPLVALVLTPSTHRRRGPQAARDLLAGVVTGSTGAAALAITVLLVVR